MIKHAYCLLTNRGHSLSLTYVHSYPRLYQNSNGVADSMPPVEHLALSARPC